MFNGSNAPSVADIAAIGDGNDGWGGGAWWPIIILFALFGWGRNGFGFGGGSGCGCDSACATVGDVERGFNQQTTNQRFNALDNGLAQLGYANQQQGYETRLAIADAAAQQAQCCCDTQRAIDGVNFNMAQGFCQLGNTVQSSARDIIDNQNCGTQRIIDQICAFRMEDKNETIAELRSQVQALNLAQSQANQNQYLLGRLQPYPQPAYQVANPYATYSGCGCCGTACC